MLQEQAKIERDDFQRICNEQKNQREQQLKIEKEKQELRLFHAQELRKQIILSEDEKKQEERDKLEEGKKIKDNLNKYKSTIENIKQQKL